MISNGIGRFHELNPDWDIQIYTDEDVQESLESALSEHDYRIIRENNRAIRPMATNSNVQYLWMLTDCATNGCQTFYCLKQDL